VTAPLDVKVVRTGTANVASVLAALGRVGARAEVIEDGTEVERAALLVLPGVGTLDAAMKRLREHALVEPLKQRLAAGRPTLAICLGMQLLCRGSEENPGQPGLAVIDAEATRFPDTVRVPQLGWNRVDPGPGCRLLKPGYAYFANSFRLERVPEGWVGALAGYGGPFVAALEKQGVLACQFHPELSGSWGLGLIRQWLEACLEEGGDAAC